LNTSTRSDMDDKVICVGVGQNITKIRQVDRSRNRVTADLRRLIDHANAPVFGIDVHGNETEWNQAASCITGYIKKEMLGKSLLEAYINPEYQGLVSKVFPKALRGEDTANFEFPIFSKNRDRLEILLTASARSDIDGKLTGVGVGHNITKIRLAEHSREFVTDLRRLIDYANAPISDIDVHGNMSRTKLPVAVLVIVRMCWVRVL